MEGSRGSLAVMVCLCALVPIPAAASGVLSPFTEEALARGLDFTMSPYPQPSGFLGHGCGFVDLDSDGDPDVVLIGRSDGRLGIFENIGGGNFVDHTLTTGVLPLVHQEGFAAADYDADGLIDLYVTQAINQPNLLLRNNGNFTFTNLGIPSGTFNGPQNSTGPTWGDYDNDGWLDLYVPIYGSANWLYRNNGNGTFGSVAQTLGVTGGTGLSFLTVWTDYDRDGDVDLYLSNDRAPTSPTIPGNILWRNDGGTFVDVSAGSGADVSIYSMGIAAGDVDDNLYPDLYVTNIHALENDGSPVGYQGLNPLLLNQGNGQFVDSTTTWGTQNESSSWSAIFFDWDNDGRKDLYVNNQFDPNHFFHCDTVPCTEKAQAMGVEAAFDPDFDFQADPADLPEYASFSSAVADVDGDGDLDLLVNNLGHRAELFINREGEKRNWVRYELVGVYPNNFAVGAGVETTATGKTQFHEIYAGGHGYLGQNETTVHVGLDQDTVVEQTVVQWPSNGPTRTLTGLPANETWTLYPPARLCDDDGDGVDYDDFLAFGSCFATGFSPGCEMMDFDGDSDVYADDLADCFVAAPADCNGNGTEDLVEILLDPGLDGDQDSDIDCCDPGPATDPNAVGNTLLVDRDPSGNAVLSWTSPAADATHDPATSYDVFGAADPAGNFALLANVATPGHTDATPADVYYVVGARNACGSSGEEPF